MIRLRVFLALLLALLACPASWALEVREKRWGFDGKVRPGRFNVLSVMIDNPGARAFDGQLVLEDRRGMEKSIGAPLVQPIYLAPGTRRWVQFHVFINQPGGDWLLRWGKGPKERESIEGAQFGPPARVLLIDPESAFAAPGGLRSFPDDLFPTTVAATDALEAVALDHVPRWEAARREAFVDWLRRGSTVHLLRGPDGQFPPFADTLTALNVGADRTRVGAGLVVRHEAARGEVTEQFLSTHGFPAAELKTDVKVLIYNLDTQLLQKLAALTKPEIAWWLIYLLTAGYVLVVGPAHYRWSKRLPYLRSIALLVAIVAGFAGAFAFAGRRGANETQQVRAIAIAHSLGEGRHDVTQWISAFATKGDLYKLSHAAPANLYSTATEFDSVNGAIFNGRDGHFDVDIPLFSTRPFLHRGVLRGDRTEMAVSEWKTDQAGDLSSLALVPGEGFPAKVEHAWAQHRELFYELEKAGERWVLTSREGKKAAEFFTDNHFQELNETFSQRGVIRFGGSADEVEKTDDAWLGKAGPVLIARALGNVEGLAHFVTHAARPAEQVRVFLQAPLPEGFYVREKRFGNQQGAVLYVQDIFKP